MKKGKTRSQRLAEGNCPLHGRPLNYEFLENIYSDPCIHCGEEKILGELQYLSCERKDCNIKAVSNSITNKYELLPEFKHLLENEGK